MGILFGTKRGVLFHLFLISLPALLEELKQDTMIFSGAGRDFPITKEYLFNYVFCLKAYEYYSVVPKIQETKKKKENNRKKKFKGKKRETDVYMYRTIV